MLKEAFGDNAVGQTHPYEWFKHFRNRWMSVDEKHSRWTLTRTTIENVAKLWEAILEDRQRTIHSVCNIVRLSYGMS